jgi:hypothetical protein
MLYALIDDGRRSAIVRCPTEAPMLAIAPTRDGLIAMMDRYHNGRWAAYKGRRLYIGPTPFRDIADSPKARYKRLTRKRAKRLARAISRLRRILAAVSPE